MCLNDEDKVLDDLSSTFHHSLLVGKELPT